MIVSDKTHRKPLDRLCVLERLIRSIIKKMLKIFEVESFERKAIGVEKDRIDESLFTPSAILDTLNVLVRQSRFLTLRSSSHFHSRSFATAALYRTLRGDSNFFTTIFIVRIAVLTPSSVTGRRINRVTN